MKRNVNLFLIDILDSISDAQNFMEGVSKKSFFENKEKQNAVIRTIEIIGEAVKNIPPSFRTKHPHIEWSKIAGMRDIIIHGYFRVDLNAVWNVVRDDLPSLKEEISSLINF